MGGGDELEGIRLGEIHTRTRIILVDSGIDCCRLEHTRRPKLLLVMLGSRSYSRMNNALIYRPEVRFCAFASIDDILMATSNTFYRPEISKVTALNDSCHCHASRRYQPLIPDPMGHPTCDS